MAVIPSTDVNLATEVRDVLNAAGGSVSNDTTSFFKDSANINMWSKYKPVVSKDLFYTYDEWINGDAWRGADGKCGLTILSKTTSMQDFHNYLDDGSALWSYTPPKGGETEPLRLGDFRGYNPDAINPVGEITTDGFVDQENPNAYDYVQFDVDVATNLENNLEYGDILIGGKNGTPLTQFYFGIYAQKGNTYTYKTHTSPLSNDYNFSIDLKLTHGEWKITPFFCSVMQDGLEGDGLEGVYLGANIPTKTFTIRSTNDKVILTVNGIWDYSKTVVQDIFVEIRNTTNSDITIDRIGIELRGSKGTTDNSVGNPAVVYYKRSASNTITIAANSSITTNIGEFESISLGDTGEYDNYYLNAFAFDGDEQYNHTNQIEEQS